MTRRPLIQFLVLGAVILIATGGIKKGSRNTYGANSDRAQILKFNSQTESPNSDSAQIEISELFDTTGLLEKYRILVNTPICEKDKCYEVELEFFSDPIGKFLNYDTLQGQELTKLDHIPFEEADYGKLQEILSNGNSVLANYSKDELVSDTRYSEIDGFTGATILEVKNSVIEGAVYSCYTLWHIAHGPLVDSLQRRTASGFTPALVDKLVSQNRQQVNYFLIEHLSEKQFTEYLPQVLQTIENGQGYYAKNAIEKMPAPAVNTEMAQQFFAEQFKELDYFAQVSLLKKLEREQLTEGLKQVLRESLEERSSLKEELVKGLIDTLNFPPCDIDDIPHYTAHKINSPIRIDGKLQEKAWLEAPRSTSFRDLVSGASTIHDTQAAVLWDDEFLYVGYWIEEPNLQATLTERDAPIYKDNDVELFIAGEDAYYEFEINAYGTIYEVLFIWEESYVKKGYNQMEEFNRQQPGVRTFRGVGYKNHPRGNRIGYWNWDLEGLRSAVYLDGTINDDSDRDRGWTVEIAIPWEKLEVLTGDDTFSLPPDNNDVMRMDFSRFNQYKEAPPANDSGGWAWSPHGVWDSHVPECFTYVHFSTSGW